MQRDSFYLVALAVPAGCVFAAFFLVPLAQLFLIGAGGAAGFAGYLSILTNPRHFDALISTVVLSAGVTAVTLAISGTVGVFLQRNRFPGRSVLISLLTLPLAFPGVVIGFMVIMLAGRQGLI